MAWPVIRPASANDFLDHFPGSSLSSRWTAVTSGTGAVTVTDSYADISSPANSAAFIYRNVKLDKSKSQMWMICMARQSATQGEGGLLIVNGASAPVAAIGTTIDAKTLIERNWAAQDSLCVFDYYFSNAGTQTFWNGNQASPVWTTSYATSLMSITPVQDDDYYILGLEIDGPNQRWRLHGWGHRYATGGTFTFVQGWLYWYNAQTDWVTWANTRSNADLWLCLGNLKNDLAGTMNWRVEWVRYGESPDNVPLDAWCASKDLLASEHKIRHYTSYDGKMFMPEDRSTWALNLGSGGAYDDLEIQEPRGVSNGVSTDYLFYTATKAAGNVRSIAVATATRARPQNGPWTKSGSNPIIALGSAGQNDDNSLGWFDVVYDTIEADANKRWKLLYAAQKASDSKWRVMYATAPSPTGTWTKQGTVIDVGGASAKDEQEARHPVVTWTGALWEVWYEAVDTASPKNEYLLRATGTDLGSLTKDGVDYTATVVSATQSLTANLNTDPGRSVTVADSSGFVQDGAVIFSQSTTQDDWAYSKVRKIPDSTHVELYHGLTGFTTTYPAKIRQMDASRNRTPRVIIRVGSEWYFYIVIWEPWFNSSFSASYAAVSEEMHLFTHSSPNAADVVATIQYQPNPVIPRGSGVSALGGDERSVENMTFMTDPFGADAVTAIFEYPHRRFGPF